MKAAEAARTADFPETSKAASRAETVSPAEGGATLAASQRSCHNDRPQQKGRDASKYQISRAKMPGVTLIQRRGTRRAEPQRL